MATRQGSKADTQPGNILLVVHDFIARSQDELSLAKGDRIELIERDDDFGDGWYLGRHMNNGNSGLFPEVYTTPAPKGTLSNAANGHRRATENSARPTTANDNTSLQQHRQSSAPLQHRPASASSPKTSSPLAQSHPTIRTTLPNDNNSYNTMNMQSPVMNETLSVINEHIVDMNTPRTSFMNGTKQDMRASMGSVYSTQPRNRMSYIAGHETDEEEHELHTEEEVMDWSPERVAEYLEDHGVEKSHCESFKDQEISGDVLLAMEQSSVFMKEFDLGPVGRRLRTWHKIKALQDEVRSNSSPEVTRSTSNYSTGGASDRDDASSVGDSAMGRTRSTSAASALPRGLQTRQSIDGRAGTMQSYQQQPTIAANRTSGMISPLQTMASFSRPENTSRPSAQNIRAMQHSRRHSSIGSINSTASAGTSRTGHRKHPSLDSNWQFGQSSQSQTNGRARHSHALSSDSTRPAMNRQFSLNVPGQSSPNDLDRGYFSSTEVDTRSKPRHSVLQKKTVPAGVSPNPSRPASYIEQQRNKLSSQVPVAEASLPDLNVAASTGRLSDATTAVNSKLRSARMSSMPTLQNKPMVASEDPNTPVVTKLEYDSTPSSLNAIASSPTTQTSEAPSAAQTRSPMSVQLPFFITKSKVKGLRTTSDRVTTTEKSSAASPKDSIPSPVKENEVSSPTRTGSTTPSTEARSFDMQGSTTRTSTGSGNNLTVPPVNTGRRPQRKNKQETSAYTRGLEKKTPAEQMEGADYSGWMKKKSGSLMTTWKPRLFVLKGRRLSYYYSENDTEEKGLIDISYHNVIAAHNEKLTGLHAAMTGAANSPGSPKENATFTSAQQDAKQFPPKAGSGDGGLFIFKLAPPKTGRGATFTKPTVHYFAVNSRQEGRLWMAALMKAVIDRDQDGVVTTTYNQKTISLAKARARRERPPALQEEPAEVMAAEVDAIAGADDGASAPGSSEGLGIDGLNGDAAVAAMAAEGASVVNSEKTAPFEDGSSIALSSVYTGTEGGADTPDDEDKGVEKEVVVGAAS